MGAEPEAGNAADDRSEPAADIVDVVDVVVMFTDIAGSTTRWEQDPSAMSVELAAHDSLSTHHVEANHGTLFKHTGDGIVAHFERAELAVQAAIALQRALSNRGDEGLRVRIGLHRGEVEQRGDDLFGVAMSRASRIMDAGHAGQILVSARVVTELADQLAPEVETIPLGTYRLKGLTQPEEIHQIVATGLDREHPPLRTLNQDLGNAPIPPTDLVGRSHDLETVSGLLNAHHIVSLVGPGGVGKTALGLHLARTRASDSPDGVWFVDLTLASTDDRVVGQVAETLSIERPKHARIDDAIADAVRRRQMTVVLDNCEHVLEGASRAVEALTGRGDMVTVLCTSQRRLGVAGEQVHQVGPLEADVSDLFCLRAREANPGFDPDGTDMESIRHICDALDGLPLAIELAASRCRSMSVAKIEAHLGSPLRLLRSRDGIDRHRTIESTIEWSFGLLETDAQRLFEALAIFPGPFDVSAAARVAGLDELDAADLVGELVDRSLIAQVGSHLRLLESIRAFADRRLDEREGDRAAVARRHAAWLLDEMPDPIDHVDPARASANVRTAAALVEDAWVAVGTLLPDEPQAATDLVLTLNDLWIADSRADDAIEWLMRCVEVELDHPRRMAVLGWLSGFSWMAGHNDDVRTWAERGLDEAARDGEPLPAYAATRLLLHNAFVSDTKSILSEAPRVLEAARRDPTNASRLISVIAIVHAIHGDDAAAARLAEESIELARSAGALRLSTALMNRLLARYGDPSNHVVADEMLSIAEQLGRRNGTGQAKFARALCERAAGNTAGYVVGLADALQSFVETHEAAHIGATLSLVPLPLSRFDLRTTAIVLGKLAATTDGPPSSPLVTRKAHDAMLARLHEALGAETFDALQHVGTTTPILEVIDLVAWSAEQLKSARVAS